MQPASCSRNSRTAKRRREAAGAGAGARGAGRQSQHVSRDARAPRAPVPGDNVKGAGAEEGAAGGATQRAAQERGGGAGDSWRAWVWKREGRPDRDRFQRPYMYPLEPGTGAGAAAQHCACPGREAAWEGPPQSTPQELTIQQRPFSTTGFASTVWDSAIVLAKFLEMHPETVRGKRCLELGAGCGLPGLVCRVLGASEVVLSDLPDNIPLLRTNINANAAPLSLASPDDDLGARSKAGPAEGHPGQGRNPEALRMPATVTTLAEGSCLGSCPAGLGGSIRALPLEWGSPQSLLRLREACAGAWRAGGECVRDRRGGAEGCSESGEEAMGGGLDYLGGLARASPSGARSQDEKERQHASAEQHQPSVCSLTSEGRPGPCSPGLTGKGSHSGTGAESCSHGHRGRGQAGNMGPCTKLAEAQAQAGCTVGGEGAGCPVEFDVVLGADLLYYEEGIPLLAWTLQQLAPSPATLVLLSCGRNRQAAPLFFRAMEGAFEVHSLGAGDLHPVYQCADVDVWRLVRR